MKYLLLLFTASFSHVSFGQCYWQQEVDYQMEIDFDVDNHTFQGTQKLVYINNSPDTLKKVFFHLYFNAFQPNSMMDVRSRTIVDPDGRVKDRISKLSKNETGFHEIELFEQDGKKLDFHIEGTVAEVSLSSPILPNDSTIFYMEFNSQVPKQIRRSGRNNKEGISYSMTQWFPKIAEYDFRGWHASPYVAREFYSPWGNYDVTIKIDKSFMVAGSGVLQNPQEIGYGYEKSGTDVKRPSGGKLEWRFVAENVHDFAWSADPDYVHTKIKVPNGPLIHFFYQENEKYTKNWKALPEYVKKIFEYVSIRYGKYPYPVYSVIQGGDGGMEYPMATLITGNRNLQSLVGVTVHEVLHSWYQGVLATNESTHAWMDEGFTSYVSAIVMAFLFDQDGNPMESSYKSYTKLVESGKEEPMTTHADHFTTNYAYSIASYVKGALCVDQLGYVIGNEVRDAGLRRYFKEWKFRHPQLNDFVRVMEKTSGLELDWYFEYWVNTTHFIDYAIEDIAPQKGNTTIKLKKVGGMPMPVDMKVTLTNGKEIYLYIPLGLMRGEKNVPSDWEILSDWHWTNPDYTVNLNLKTSKILRIEIDPENRTMDIDRGNNSWSR